MMHIKPWPVTVGILVDSAGSIVFGVAYSLVTLGRSLARGEPPDAPLGTTDLVIVEIVGLLFTAIGGFVAARMAKTFELRHGIAVGVGGLVIWLLVELVGPADDTPGWYNAISFLALVPAGAFGGYIASVRRKRSAPPQEPA